MAASNSSEEYFCPRIAAMSGYTPGEQPKDDNLVKLNTNENPYPPSPKVAEVLKNYDIAKLRLYPDPLCNALRDVIAKTYGFARENVIVGNGSDDILTMIFRSFTDPKNAMACMHPTYSLYETLAEIQGCRVIKVDLKNDFALPENLLEQTSEANLVIFTRPNAPTGNSFAKAKLYNFCDAFKGIVLIDEAYADFAEDSCLAFVHDFDNVIVARTLSKSYALAGLRVGFALSSPQIILGLQKVKDSYNVDALSQLIAIEAITDKKYFHLIRQKVQASRNFLENELEKLGFAFIKSQANFIFVEAPHRRGQKLFDFLRQRKILVRYFSNPRTAAYVRITVGTASQNKLLLAALAEYMTLHN